MYVKTGVLDDQSKMRVKPDVHIFTDTKVEWVDLKSEIEKGVPVCEEFYDPADVWSKGSLERLEKLREWKAQQDPSDVTL